MIGGGSVKTPAKGDDIFNFLNQPTDPKSKEDTFSAFATPNMSTGKTKDVDDMFAVLSGSKKEEPQVKSSTKPLKENLTMIEEKKSSGPTNQEVAKIIEEAKWGDDEEIELEDDLNEGQQ